MNQEQITPNTTTEDKPSIVVLLITQCITFIVLSTFGCLYIGFPEGVIPLLIICLVLYGIAIYRATRKLKRDKNSDSCNNTEQ